MRSFFTRMLFSKLVAEQSKVANDDPRRSPNWCWMHDAMYPACIARH